MVRTNSARVIHPSHHLVWASISYTRLDATGAIIRMFTPARLDARLEQSTVAIDFVYAITNSVALWVLKFGDEISRPHLTICIVRANYSRAEGRPIT